MQLQLATWPEVEAYLETSTGIIVPIGSTEQHGPTGLIGTDALTAEVIGRRVGEETGALVAPRSRSAWRSTTWRSRARSPTGRRR